jgi:hypothetical protein
VSQEILSHAYALTKNVKTPLSFVITANALIVDDSLIITARVIFSMALQLIFKEELKPTKSSFLVSAKSKIALLGS